MLKPLNLFLFIGLVFLSGCSLRQKQEDLGFYYRIRKGDTLASIAHACDISLWELRKQNTGRKSFDPGDLVFIPRTNSNLKDLMATRRDFYTNPYNSADFELLPEVKPPEPYSPSTFKIGSLDVYRRAYWGAGSVKTSDINYMSQINRITVHHTTVLPVYRNKSNAEIVKSIFNFHRHNKGWADIGYHYLIGSDGTVYEGRQEKFQGAHAGANNNKYNLGIALIGDFTQQRPSRQQLQTLEMLITEKVRTHNISPDQIFGHRDLKSTECPGLYLYQELQSIKRRLASPLLSFAK